MPWKTCDLMESREAFVLDYLRGGLSFSELCRRHGISRVSGYKWVGRHRAEGGKGLLDRSRRPRSSPRRSSPELEAAVVSIRLEHPVWGGRKIRRVLQDRGCPREVPAASTISSILRRHGLLGRGTREGSRPVERFERGEPNDLWQMDFKGWIRLGNGRRCRPLTIRATIYRWRPARRRPTPRSGRCSERHFGISATPQFLHGIKTRSPTARANEHCRLSKLTNGSAWIKWAQTTCKISNVRQPSV